MEYLMTYGWAILIIMVVLAILFYLGILKPRTPTYCIFPTGFSCVTHQLSAGSGKLYLLVGQATGRTIIVTGVNCTQNTSDDFATNGVITYGAPENRIVMMSGTQAILSNPNDPSKQWLSISCVDANGKPISDTSFGTIYNGKIYIKYIEADTQMTRVVVGSLLTTYEIGSSSLPTSYCGDGSCNPGEDCGNCPADCLCHFCGDGSCDPGEDFLSCPEDCMGIPQPPSCNNNGVCDVGEDCGSCPGDCPCPPGSRCCTQRIDGGSRGTCTPLKFSCPV
ncbi:MAG: hypothetical protein QXF56_00535 [Candidatus Micrarchaeia archaeon]